MGIFSKLNILTKNSNNIEANAVKVTLFSKTINHIGQSVKEGRIANKTAGGVVIVTIIGYIIAYKFPESDISRLLIDNAESIVLAVSAIASILVTTVKK